MGLDSLKDRIAKAAPPDTDFRGVFDAVVEYLEDLAKRFEFVENVTGALVATPMSTVDLTQGARAFYGTDDTDEPAVIGTDFLKPPVPYRPESEPAPQGFSSK